MLEVRRTKQAARARMADSLKAESDNRDAEENALIQKVMEEKWRAEDEREVRKVWHLRQHILSPTPRTPRTRRVA